LGDHVYDVTNVVVLELTKLDKYKRFDETIKVWIAVATILVSINISMVRDFVGPTVVATEGFFLVLALVLWSFNTLFASQEIALRMGTVTLLALVVGIAFITFMTWREPTIVEIEGVIAITFLALSGSVIYLKKSDVNPKQLKLSLVFTVISAIILMLVIWLSRIP